MQTDRKFTIAQSELHRLLNLVKHAVAAKPIVPIYEFLKIDVRTSARYITLTASNEVNMIQARSADDSIEEQKDFPFSMCVPAKTLISLVALLPPSEPITFVYTQYNRKLRIECAENNYDFGCQNPDDFPDFPKLESKAVSFQLDSEVLTSAISYAAYAISNDPQRMNLTGMYIGAAKNKLTISSCDGQKLVRYIRNDVVIDYDISMLIPKAGVTVLQKILPKNETITIAASAQRVIVSSDMFLLSMLQIKATYPNIESAIHFRNASQKINFQVSQLNDALTRIHLLAESDKPYVTFVLVPDRCIITTEDMSRGRAATERFSLSHTVTEKVCFRLQDLESMLANIPGHAKELTLSMEASNKAVYFTPTAPQEEEDLLILVLPYLTNVYA